MLGCVFIKPKFGYFSVHINNDENQKNIYIKEKLATVIFNAEHKTTMTSANQSTTQL